MSVTPNLCCDKTEPRSIHSPDNTNRDFKLPISELESPDRTDGLGILFLFFLDCVIADDIQDHNSVLLKHHVIFDKN